MKVFKSVCGFNCLVAMKGIHEQITQTIRRWKREPSDNISHLVATVGSILLLFASVIIDSNNSSPEKSLFVYSILPAYVSLSMIFLFAMWFLINDHVVLKTARDVSLTLMFQTLIITLIFWNSCQYYSNFGCVPYLWNYHASVVAFS
jgi:uncharacterized membrane protein